MKNEIGRKLTSLTLLSILLVSGVTIAMPGAMPAAEAAHNANLFVSAENSQFSNYFGGPMVVEIVVSDSAISSLDDILGEPDVTVNGNDVRMVQGNDGSWYAYIADRLQAQRADQTVVAGTAGEGLDFGKFCAPATDIGDGTPVVTAAGSVGIALPDSTDGSQGTTSTASTISTSCTTLSGLAGDDTNNVVREYKDPNTSTGIPIGQIALESVDVWPFIQLYNFNPTGTVEIKYNKAGGVQTTTLTFDTMDTFSSISLDRTTYPQGAEVHAVITDGQLNIDPTDEDSWTFGTDAADPEVIYQHFTEDGTDDSGADSVDIAPSLSTLMFEDNGIVKLNGAVSGTTVLTLDDNEDEVLLTATSLAAATTSALAAGNQPVTFLETSDNNGIFSNTDNENNDANINILTTAPRGESGSIDYNKSAKSIVVGFGFGSVDIAAADGEWNSGEEIPVSLVDTDANKNSRVDEDLDLNDPNVALIPSLRIGVPFTLLGSDDAEFFNISVSATNSATLAGVGLAFVQGGATVIGSTSVTEQSFSDRLVLAETADASSSGTFKTALIIDLDNDIEGLQASIKDPQGTGTATRFKGLNLFNYDLRSITGEDSTFASVSAYLLVNRTGSGDTLFSTSGITSISTTDIVAISLGNSTSQSGLINLNTTSTVTASTGAVAAATLADSDDVYDNLFSASNLATDDIGLMFVFNPTGVYDFDGDDDDPIVADFFTFGITGDGLETTDRTNNAIYRFELEESGDNTSTFIGTAEYTMLNQLNIFDDSVYSNLRTIDDEVTFVVHEDLTDEDAPRVNYLDLGADGVSTQIADQQAAPSHSGVVTFDKEAYKVADTVTVTLEDQDLNVDSDLIDIYVSFTDLTGAADPAVDTVGEAGLFTYTDGTAFGRLLDITFDDERWVDSQADFDTDPAGADCTTNYDGTNTALDDGLFDAGFTLVESGTATGVFRGDFQIPGNYCSRVTATSVSTTGTDIEVNYVDFRDGSGETIEVGDGAGVRANTGSISLDRTVYPVPFGEVGDFTGVGTALSDESFFPVHSQGITSTIGATEALPLGDLTIHVRVNDPDFDISAAGEDKIQTDLSTGVGPVKISVSRGSDEVVLAYAGGPAAQTGEIDVADNNAAGTRELGPITEIAPNAGIFELDLRVLHTDGPSSTSCPTTDVYETIDGTTDTTASGRFDDSGTTDVNTHCILQGDILTVEYTDPTDSSGDLNTVTDSATFDLRNGVLQSDKSVYIIGSDMILTLIEPDLDLDTDAAESWDLDLIEWDSDAAEVTMGDLDGESASFDPEPSAFRETGDSTGIFQVVIEIPSTLASNQLDRGEKIQLEYTDWGPSGANYVGDEDEDINLTIYTSNFGATVELDQKVYTWTDKVFITIVAPDHNFDSNLIDEIGNTADDKITVSTRSDDLKEYKLVETGTDTGIFTGEVILTGFSTHDADGDGTTGDASGTGPTPATDGGPTDGLLPADDDDGLTVSFEFTEDETVVGSALIRWNIGEVQFLEASYPATGQGVVRVVDPDMNLKPESVDNFDIDVWSDSDAGGIDLTVTETNEATGIFEGAVFFTVTDESSGHRLRVAEGDTVTAEYEDNTLPSPYTTADELEIAATTFIGSIVPPLERAPASNPRVVDAFGNELDEVNVDQQVQITADLANGQDRDQSFAYLVQIQDEDGVTVSLSWITGSLAPGQSLNPAQSWTPTSPGSYNVQIFVWESVDNPDALSPPVSTTITVV